MTEQEYLDLQQQDKLAWERHNKQLLDMAKPHKRYWKPRHKRNIPKFVFARIKKNWY